MDEEVPNESFVLLLKLSSSSALLNFDGLNAGKCFQFFISARISTFNHVMELAPNFVGSDSLSWAFFKV